MDEWMQHKLKAWDRLWEDLEIGYLDTDILHVLLAFFAYPDAYTVSSCSGRISVVDAPYPWVKDESTIVFKKHGKVAYYEVEDVLKRPYKHKLWLVVQGPIYHVYTRSLEAATEILAIVRAAGFKHSGIIAVNEKGFLVEAQSGIGLAAPLNPIADCPPCLRALVEEFNQGLAEAKERNRRLFRVLCRSLPPKPWPQAVAALTGLVGVNDKCPQLKAGEGTRVGVDREGVGGVSRA